MHRHFSTKDLLVFIAAPALGLAFLAGVLFSVILPSVEESLVAQKKETLRLLTQTAFDILLRYENFNRKGKLTVDEAQRQALQEIRFLRYGPENKDYFWINDMRPYMLMHPYRSDLEGKSIADFSDPTGKRLFWEMVQTVRQRDAGFVSYRWQWKDDPHRIVPKLSYVRKFPPWNWMIGTGMYLEDVRQEIGAIKERLILIFSLIFSVMAVLGFVIGRQGLRAADRRRQAEDALQHHLSTLEETVAVRTKELTTAKEFLQNIIESLPYPFFVVGADDFRIQMANSAASKMGDWIDRFCHEMSHRRNTPCAEAGEVCPVIEVKRTGKPSINEHLHTDQEGNTNYVEVHGYPIFNEQGDVDRVIEYAIDISDRKRAEFALRDALKESQRLSRELGQRHNELKLALHDLRQTQAQMLQQEKMASIGVLAAGVAHEINNPIGYIISNLGSLGRYLEKLTSFLAAQSRLLQQGGQETDLAELRKELKIDYISEDCAALVAESIEGADRVKEIVQNLKSFSRVDEAREKMADINDCIEKTVKLVWNELKYKAVVEKELGDLPPTCCRPQELNQVFMNILLNAAHAIEKDGVIAIKTWQVDDTIHVAISDTGQGISEEDMPRIFDPFFTTKPVGKGTGLGLSISFEIIRKHGGNIHVTSEKGKGTTFTIDIPVAQATQS